MRIFGYEIRKAKKQEDNPIFPQMGSFLGFSGKGGWQNIASIFKAIELISNNISMLPIQVINKHTNETIDHSINEVFEETKYGKQLLMKTLVTDLLVFGNAYLHIERTENGKISKIEYLHPNSVQVTERQEDFIYKVINKTKYIECCNIIHLRNNVQGKSILGCSAETRKTISVVQEMLQNYYQNGATLNGILSVNSTLSEQQAKDLHKRYMETFYNKTNSVVVLPGGMDFKPISNTLRDSQLNESVEHFEKDIARYFNIPLDILNGENIEIDKYFDELISITLLPYITLIEDEFNKKLLLPSERKEFVIDLNERTLLRLNKKIEYYIELLKNGVISINELRAEIGYKEIGKEGDKHFIPYTDINQNTLTNGEDE